MSNSTATNVFSICQDAKIAAAQFAIVSSKQKDECLRFIANRIIEQADAILTANAVDIAAAQRSGLSPALVDRLSLNPQRIADMAQSLIDIAKMPDPVGETFVNKTMPNGLHLVKRRMPIGVLAVIYEARPNVTTEVAGVSIKTGNVVILRGGSETISTNRALISVIHHGIQHTELPVQIVSFINNPDRGLVLELLKMHDYIDMLIPRGGNQLHQFCRENSSIPVITGGIGICHLFVDESANQDASLGVIRNAKIQRPTVCNALDTVLVHKEIATEFLPRLIQFLQGDGVNFRAHANALPYLADFSTPLVTPAGEEDFDTEWLSLVLGLKIVDGMEEAIQHIQDHSTRHSDGILTENQPNADLFTQVVDSAVVYVNASTRFTDGGQLGLGAEVAVSTQRLHARGPMGLEELTTYKWVAQGNYLVRD